VQVYESAYSLQPVFDSVLEPGQLRRVLDAGCGSARIDLAPEVELTGIDLSPEAIARNPSIDVAIVGDIQTYPLPHEYYDAIFCWFVLEHVPEPASAIRNMAGALAPGGILAVAVPYIWSLKAAITKLTPFPFHVWAYRHVLGWPQAGLPGHGPYKTYLRFDLSPSRMRKLAEECGLLEVQAVHIHASLFTDSRPILERIWRGTNQCLSWLSFGRYDRDLTDYVVIFRRPA
jgi:SAM-dependent methyltransferase